ncbi:poly(ADP-ribose) glycohydrolase [Aulostomus maculatus]
MARPYSRSNDSSQMRAALQHETVPIGGEASDASSSSPRTTRADRDEASSCCQLKDLRRIPQCHVKLGPLDFSSTHTVLIDVDTFHRGGGAVALRGREPWQSNVVKMPCSPFSLMTTKSAVFKQQSQTSRWDVISKQLMGLAKKTSVNVDAVEDAIMKYNPKYKGQWSFDALHSFVKCVPKTENYYHTLFPKMAVLALRLPELVKKAIPLLQRGHAAAITLSQAQIACLLANAFFCTFPHRNTSAPTAEYHNYPSINFSSLFGNWSERKKEKLRAIMHYFSVVTDENSRPDGLVTFERRCLHDSDVPKWRSCAEKMCDLYVSAEGSIETEGTGMLQVDFASSWIGGGILDSGLVQEEILFLMNPELIVSRLFTERLGDNECLIITGSQQFSCYSGFSDSFEWAGPHQDILHRDGWARLERQILAIDALRFKSRREQFSMIKVTRELNKAYCGFKGRSPAEPAIATGKWGCGVYNGDPHLKAVIQLMAAAKARRGLAFFTFLDDNLKQDVEQMHHLLVTEGVTVGKLYGLLEDFCAREGSQTDLFDDIRMKIGRSRSLL